MNFFGYERIGRFIKVNDEWFNLDQVRRISLNGNYSNVYLEMNGAWVEGQVPVTCEHHILLDTNDLKAVILELEELHYKR